jgi:hypothetical protein
MRRILVLLAAIGLVGAILPATVAAAKPVRDGISQSGIFCELSTDVGLANVFVEVSGPGGFASLALWTAGTDPEVDLPNIITEQGMATFDGERLNASFELVFVEESENPEEPPTFTPAGSATVEAILTPYGDLQDFTSDPLRDGNRWIRQGLFVQLLSVNGTLSVDLLDGPDATAPLTNCGASTTDQTLFATNPDAYVLDGDQLVLSCSWTTALGTAELLAVNDDFGTTFSQLIIVERDSVLVGLAVPEFSATAYLADYELFDPISGNVLGAASADAVLAASGERINDREWVENTRFSLVGGVLTVDGAVSITVDGATTELSMDDAACEATDLRVKVIERIARG